MLAFAPGVLADVVPPRAAQIAQAIPAPGASAPGQGVSGAPSAGAQAAQAASAPTRAAPASGAQAASGARASGASPGLAAAAAPSSAAGGREGGPRWAPPIVHSLAVMTGTRLVEAYLYPEPFARVDVGFWGERYRDAFTKPPVFDMSKPFFRWDDDPWPINVVGHALMGSEYYLRARSCRFSPLGAFAFAAGASAVWEYAFEANGVRPSGLDLVYTPLAGLVLGEARYQAWRAASGLSSPAARAAVRGALDPFGELERGVGLFAC